MAHITSITNQKGGVGKTSTTHVCIRNRPVNVRETGSLD